MPPCEDWTPRADFWFFSLRLGFRSSSRKGAFSLLMTQQCGRKYTLEEYQEMDRLLAMSLPACPVCGGLGWHAGWLHYECRDKLARKERALIPKTPQERMRTRWNGMKKRMKPLIIVRYGSNCVSCGIIADSIDHVVPISKGGTNDIENLRPMCRSCNSRKKDRQPKGMKQ